MGRCYQKTIYKSSDFGKELEITSHFKDDLASLVATEAPSAEKIGKIFQFVKSKIKWNGYHSKYTSDGVRKAYKEGVGNVAEINLTLVAMLREAGIKANPILVSTRDNGIPIFPTTDGFNYVISGVEIGDQIVMLDATEQYSLPNVLPLRDINWQGRIVREDGTSDWVDLTTNNPSLKNSIMKIDINDEGEIEGMNRVQYSNLEALKYRNKNAKIKEEDIIIKAEEENGGIEISEFKVDNKTNLDKSVIEVYKFSSEELTDVMGDKIYFKPLLFNALEENLFKLEKREYPIDFGTPLVSKNMLSITIPEGFSVESLPENLAIGLPNKYGVYKFDISVNGNKIDIYSILQINTPVYPIQFYSEIKEFYKQIVNKNVEQIVLKKV
ncbi:transglutaminase-like domain-containing protein [Lutibacter sp. B1]|uniref:transglutaminase-like domain-containing protein n=1 Tax=Lutibacter sp. B1 TaxID=2725996 RepID=UPI001457646C|nr:transglutaminase-like domain-containing protein [Lutibacter sp. B1]NLP58849.1 transglutaminase domain-containing protein [Lutibacter sp. B1]